MTNILFQKCSYLLTDNYGHPLRDENGAAIVNHFYLPTMNGKTFQIRMTEAEKNEFGSFLKAVVLNREDRLIEVLNIELDDETKMRLVFAYPILQKYLVATDPA